MSSTNERLRGAINDFNRAAEAKQDKEFAQGAATEFIEDMRRRDFMSVLDKLNNQDLNTFLQQDNVQHLLDDLGTLRRSNMQIKGLAIREFAVPRSERKLGQTLTLAYISRPQEDDIFYQAASEYKINEGEILVPGPIQGLVFIKEVGKRGLKTGAGISVSSVVSIIPQENFVASGIFDNVFTQSVSPNDIEEWFDQRLQSFINCLDAESTD